MVAELKITSASQAAAEIEGVRANDVFTPTIALEVIEAWPSPPEGAATPQSSAGRILFLLIVVLPTVIAAIYFTMIAADQFASETRFMVRSPNHGATGFLSSFLQSTGFVRSHDDSYAVTEFIRSRSAVTQLAHDDGLRDIFARPEADFVMRYPLVFMTPTEEGLYRHYLHFVDVSTDSASGITTLEVRAFRAADAQVLATALLEHAEALVNRLNERARQDAVRSATAEVAEAGRRLADVQQQITDFRNHEAMVDPQHESTTRLDLVGKLTAQVAAERSQLREIEQQAPASPQIVALNARIAATAKEIDDERAAIVGSDQSMAPRIARYEELLLERDLAARMMDSATTSLENAKIEAQRQQLYLERIVEPNLPDRALYPHALFAVALIFAFSFAVYAIVFLLLVHIREQAT